MSSLVIVNDLPRCDVCKSKDAHYDAMVTEEEPSGAWANLCSECWSTMTTQTLGTGVGQRLVARKFNVGWNQPGCLPCDPSVPYVVEGWDAASVFLDSEIQRVHDETVESFGSDLMSPSVDSVLRRIVEDAKSARRCIDEATPGSLINVKVGDWVYWLMAWTDAEMRAEFNPDHERDHNTATELIGMIEGGGDLDDLEEHMGSTECPEGCHVEPDGTCSHGYRSLGLRMGLI